MRNDYYIKKAYNSTLKLLHGLGQTNWCTYVKAILSLGKLTICYTKGIVT